MSAGTPPLPEAPKPQARALNCPSCGAAIALRSFGMAETVVCSGCRSILDAKDPGLAILQEFNIKTGGVKPLIPLGTRGKLRGVDYELIGFQHRATQIDGIPYYWHEYLLFNPYKGFRYLSQYNGHWNDISICKQLPVVDQAMAGGPGSGADYLGEYYKHFQSSEATTDLVLGEFPWQVRVGEKAVVSDYVHPPRVLSSEELNKEVTWSIGEYLYGREVWEAFRLPGTPPEAEGVYENQPSPVGMETRNLWLSFAAFAALLLLVMVGFDMVSAREPVLHETYQLNRAEMRGELSFVTDLFELKGRTSNVEVKTHSPVVNHWIYVHYALINQETGQAWDFGREVSYYHGYDSDGSWTEGKQNDVVVIPSVPAGHYYFRIEPEADPTLPGIPYTVDVRRDVPVAGIYGIAFFVLLLPPLLVSLRSYSFERMRWEESDHPPTPILQTNSSEDDS